MKKTLLILALMGFGTTVGLAQTSDRTGMDNSNQAIRHDNDAGYSHNWGWIGLLGLAGLAGLGGRKSEDVRRLEATGANVKTVKTT